MSHSFNHIYVHDRISDVIDSCITLQQLHVGYKYCEILIKKWKPDLHHETYPDFYSKWLWGLYEEKASDLIRGVV